MSEIKKTAKIIRIITVAPLVALVLVNLLYFKKEEAFNNLGGYFLALFTLVILPLSAYPMQKFFLQIRIKGKPKEL